MLFRSYTTALLLAAGALDVWSTPATMKKGRPGHVVTVLSRPADADALSARLLAETGSLGARRYLVSRDIQTRSGGVVDLDGYPIRIKVGPDRAKAEFDDVAAAASALNRPLREVAAQAEFRWSRAQKELVAPTPPLASGLEDSAHQSAR